MKVLFTLLEKPEGALIGDKFAAQFHRLDQPATTAMDVKNHGLITPVFDEGDSFLRTVESVDMSEVWHVFDVHRSYLYFLSGITVDAFRGRSNDAALVNLILGL